MYKLILFYHFQICGMNDHGLQQLVADAGNAVADVGNENLQEPPFYLVDSLDIHMNDARVV